MSTENHTTDSKQDSLVDSLVTDTIEGLFQSNQISSENNDGTLLTPDNEAYLERKPDSDIDNDPIKHAGGTPI
jgi:hypothetical protein